MTPSISVTFTPETRGWVVKFTTTSYGGFIPPETYFLTSNDDTCNEALFYAIMHFNITDYQNAISINEARELWDFLTNKNFK